MSDNDDRRRRDSSSGDVDPDRLRYFTQPRDERPSRSRRRREGVDPSEIFNRLGAQQSAASARRRRRSAASDSTGQPGPGPDAVGPEAAGPEADAPEPAAPRAVVPDPVLSDPVVPDAVVPEAAVPEDRAPEAVEPESAVPDPAVPVAPVSDVTGQDRPAQDSPAQDFPTQYYSEPISPERTHPESGVEEPTYPGSGFADTGLTETGFTGPAYSGEEFVGPESGGAQFEGQTFVDPAAEPYPGGYDDSAAVAEPGSTRPGLEIDHRASLDEIFEDAPAASDSGPVTGRTPIIGTPQPSDDDPAASDLAPRSAAANRRRNRRIAMAGLASLLLVIVLVVGFVGLRATGMLDSRKDYSDAAGNGEVLVEIPENTSLRAFGDILTEADVVGSRRAFVDAADGQALSGGFYVLPKQIPAAEAVRLMSTTDNRVGRVVIPDGLQLEDKRGIDDVITPGIFSLIAQATTTDIDGVQTGVTVEELQDAAANESAAALGVPDWAEPTVTRLTDDHRRIEGLIAAGTWEYVNPQQSATEILRSLISKSSARFAQWGVTDDNDSGLSPYETLVAASVVEREVNNADDFPKVARVILNRLEVDQRLEMDSTANYTAEVTNIDVAGDAYSANNLWNTYRVRGLPVTPIGAVGERALQATEHPSEGDWLYFVTVDQQGTTLFADDFEQHKRNRDVACDNRLLSTGC